MSKAAKFLSSLVNLTVHEKWEAVIAQGRKTALETLQQKESPALDVLVELTKSSNFYDNKVACMLLRGHAAQMLQEHHISFKELREDRDKRRHSTFEKATAVLPPVCMSCAAVLRKHPSEKITRLVPFYLRQPQTASVQKEEEAGANALTEEELRSLFDPSSSRKADALKTIFLKKEELLERFQDAAVSGVLQLLKAAKETTSSAPFSRNELLYLADTVFFLMTKLLNPHTHMTAPSNAQAVALFKESFPLVVPLLEKHEKEFWYRKTILMHLIKKDTLNTLWFLVHQAEADPEKLTLKRFVLHKNNALSIRTQRRLQRDSALVKRLLLLNYFGEFAIVGEKALEKDISALLPLFRRNDVRQFIYEQHIKNVQLRIKNLEAEGVHVAENGYRALQSVSYFLAEQCIACIPDEKCRRTEIERKVDQSPAGSELAAVLRWCSLLPFPEYREKLKPSPQYGNVNLLHDKDVDNRSHALCMGVRTLDYYPEHMHTVFAFVFERSKNDQNPLKNEVWDAINEISALSLRRFYAKATPEAKEALHTTITQMLDNLHTSRDTSGHSYDLVARFLATKLLYVNEPLALSLLQQIQQKTQGLGFFDLKPSRYCGRGRGQEHSLARSTFKVLYTHVLHPILMQHLRKIQTNHNALKQELDAIGVFYFAAVKETAAALLEPLLYEPAYASFIHLRRVALEYNMRLYPEKAIPYVTQELLRKEPDVVMVPAVSNLLAKEGRENVVLSFLHMDKERLEKVKDGSYFNAVQNGLYGRSWVAQYCVFFADGQRYMQNWSSTLQEAYIHFLCDKMRPSVKANNDEEEAAAPAETSMFAQREVFILLRALPCCTIDSDPLLAAGAAEPEEKKTEGDDSKGSATGAKTDLLARELTIELMGHLTDPATLQRLLRLLEHKETAKRALTSLKMRLRYLSTTSTSAAAQAKATKRSKEAASAHEAKVQELVQLLQPALASKQVTVQKDVIAYIGRQGGNTALQTLLTFLHDKNTPKEKEFDANGAAKPPCTIHKDVFSVLLSCLEYYLDKEDVWKLFHDFVVQFFTYTTDFTKAADGNSAAAPPYVEPQHLVTILSYSRQTFRSFKAAGAAQKIAQYHYELVLTVMTRCVEAEKVLLQQLSLVTPRVREAEKAAATASEADKARATEARNELSALKRKLQDVYKLVNTTLRRLQNETDKKSAFVTPAVMDILVHHVRSASVDNGQYDKAQKQQSCETAAWLLLQHVHDRTGLITRDDFFELISHEGMYTELFTKITNSITSFYCSAQDNALSDMARSRRRGAKGPSTETEGLCVLTSHVVEEKETSHKELTASEAEAILKEDDTLIYDFFTFLLTHAKTMALLKERSKLTEILFCAPSEMWLEGLELLYKYPATQAPAGTQNDLSVLVTAALLHPGTYVAAFPQLDIGSIQRLLEREDRKAQLERTEVLLRKKADSFVGSDVNLFYFHVFLKRVALHCCLRVEKDKKRMKKQKQIKEMIAKNYKEDGNALINNHPWLKDYVDLQL